MLLPVCIGPPVLCFGPLLFLLVERLEVVGVCEVGPLFVVVVIVVVVIVGTFAAVVA